MKNNIKFLILFVGLIAFALNGDFVFAKKARKPPERSIMHNNKGVMALFEGDLDRAIFEFKTAIELQPNYVEGWSNLGVAYKYKGRLDDAESSLKKAISLDKKYAAAYQHLCAVHIDQNRYDDAEKMCNKARKYNPKLSDAYYNSAIVDIARYKQDGNKEHLLSAVKHLQDATDVNPEHPHAHKELARLYHELKEYEKAIIRFKLALEIDPTMKEGWEALAQLYTATGDTLKAQFALNKAMELDPDSKASHLFMGMNYLQDGNYKMALKEFNQVIHLDPTYAEAYFKIGFTYYKIARDTSGAQRNEALNQSNAAYESAFKLNPHYTEAAYNLAYNYEWSKNFDNASSWYKNTIASDKRYAPAYFALAMLEQNRGNKNESLSYFCQFVDLKPQDMSKEVETAEALIKNLGGCKSLK